MVRLQEEKIKVPPTYLRPSSDYNSHLSYSCVVYHCYVDVSILTLCSLYERLMVVAINRLSLPPLHGEFCTNFKDMGKMFKFLCCKMFGFFFTI